MPQSQPGARGPAQQRSRRPDTRHAPCRLQRPAQALAALRVVLVDDQRVVRAGVRRLLAAEGLRVVAEADDVEAGLHALRTHDPDVVLLDLVMPGAVEALARFRAQAPRTALLVLTTDLDPLQVRRALRAGALGCVHLGGTGEELVAAVRSVASSMPYVAASMSARIAALPDAAEGPPDDLTARELEVLQLVALGHTNAEIGEQLGLSVRTVETHRAHVQQKLGRTSRAELVRYALDHGLLRPGAVDVAD